VKDLDLNYEELQRVRRACRLIRINQCPQPHLREFLAHRLGEQAPALAAKIQQLDDGQMESLCRVVQFGPGGR
jgi:hypothetical protein